MSNPNPKSYSKFRRNRGTTTKSMNLEALRYNHPSYKTFQYYSAKYNYRPRWGGSWRRPAKERPKSPSSFTGTEEYTQKKIQETSDMIKRRLMMPESDDFVSKPAVSENSEQSESDKGGEKGESVCSGRTNNKKSVSYSVEEIHDKIITHITKLSHSKKMNLICSSSWGYDGVIQQIHKQKRLELSKALRDICSNHTVANSEIINSIIPDIGIKIEDLPLEMIQELSSTLDLNFEDSLLLQANDNHETQNDIWGLSNGFPVENQPIDRQQIKQEVFDLDFEDTTLPLVSGQTLENVDHRIKREEIDTNFESETLINNEDVVDNPEENQTRITNGNEPKCQVSSNNEQENGFQEARNALMDSCCFPEDKSPESSVRSVNPPVQSIALQTDIPIWKSVSLQTDSSLFKSQFNIDKANIRHLDDAIQAMFNIDEEITRLTKLRQSIFSELQNKEKEKQKKSKNKAKKGAKTKITDETCKKKKRKREENSGSAGTTTSKSHFKEAINLENIAEKILVIKLIQDTLLAATESGTIFYIGLPHGTITHTIKVSDSPITAIHHWTSRKKHQHLLVGSLGTAMHEFNFETRELLKVTKTKHAVQCMEQSWDYIFIGTTTGILVRYSIKQNKIEFEEVIATSNVMVLKATQEGARRVLLVGMRNAPVCIRDAMSGLHLRTLTQLVTPTVYSLVLEKSLVYCGTTFHDLLVFSFHDGSLVHRYEITNSRGIGCMKVVKNLLFASCHDGNVYVYNVTKQQYVGAIQGPGGVILSMEVLKNVVIVGTISLKFKSVLIPEWILEHNKI